MSEPMVTFEGRVTLAEAKRLVAEAEARQAEADKGPWVYWQHARYTHIWRTREDGLSDPSSRMRHNDKWRRGGTFESSCSLDLVGWTRMAPTEVNAIFPGECPEARPEPVVGQTYRHKDATDAEPHKTGWALLRYDGGQTWQYTAPDGTVGRDTTSTWHEERTWLVNEGIFAPYHPPAWTPKVGEWVQHKMQPWAKARRVVGTVDAFVDTDAVGYTLRSLRTELCPATDAELAEAKRIAVVDRLIVRHKRHGYVLRYRQPWRGKGTWINLTAPEWHGQPYDDLTTDHYDILPEFTIKGAQ